MSERAIAAFVAAFGADRVRRHAPLAPLTTFRVGGPADCLVDVGDSRDLERALALATRSGLPVTVLGGGSNVLVGDLGVRGVVIRARGGAIDLEGASRVRADAGVSLSGLVRWTIGRGLAGLEAWAGTPGSIGGAVFGNAHYARRSIGELVSSVRLVEAGQTVVDVEAAAMGFAYDWSRLQESGEIVLSVLFALEAARDPASLRETARQSLAHRKKTQPLGMPSAGCVFKNPDPETDRLPDGIPASAGALVDRAGLKGHAIGGALVSPVHANFIVNRGGATASDIRRLVELCRSRVEARFGVTLREEIRFLGE